MGAAPSSCTRIGAGGQEGGLQGQDEGRLGHPPPASRPERACAGFNSFLLLRGGSANFSDTLLLIKLKTGVSENIKNRLKFRNDF